MAPQSSIINLLKQGGKLNAIIGYRKDAEVNVSAFQSAA